MLLAVRKPRAEQVRDSPQRITRNRQRLHNRRAPGLVDVLDDGGQERAEAIQHGVDAELPRAERIHLPVPEAPPHVLSVEVLRRRRLPCVAAAAADDQGFFRGAEVGGGFGGVGEEEEGHDPD